MNPLVKTAIDAWQAGDKDLWLSHFAADAKLYDDGSPRDFRKFSDEIGKERFTNFDKIEDGGFAVYGQFHSDTWGNFRTYFKFHLNANGQFDRLDIGQAGRPGYIGQRD